VLYFNTPLDVCVARCMERAKSSGRSDDNLEAINKRLKTYEEQSKPVVEMYEKFGIVREIDGSHDTQTVWRATREAMLPQVVFMAGPMCSGKSSLGKAFCERQNAKLLNFNQFLKSNNLDGVNEDEQMLCLVKHMAAEIAPRILLEDFPQTLYQAKFFLKNGKIPESAFVLSCSKDIC